MSSPTPGDLDIAVVGSVNIDVTIPVAQLPRPGETLLGGHLLRGVGGKGANQAVAASRLGRRTAFIGCVGDDADGVHATRRLDEEGVDTTGVRTAEHPTGTAVILVADGESSIVVSPGANSALSADDIAAAAQIVRGSRAVLAQLEIPLETVVAAARCSTGLFILNPAPAQSLPAELLQQCDILVPNRPELASLAGSSLPGTIDEVADLARSLPTDARIVVTLGADGALAIDRGRIAHVPAERVRVADATAAGDTFCAALADALLDGANLTDATAWACRAAAVTVTRPGAIEALPSRAEIASRDPLAAVGSPALPLTTEASGRLSTLLPDMASSWADALNMRFVRDVAADRIPDEVFARYLILENEFVDTAAGALAGAFRQAPDRPARTQLSRILTGLTTEQYAYFRRVERDLPTPAIGADAKAQANRLSDFLNSQADSGSYLDILVCIYAAELLYLTWCAAVVNPSTRPQIAHWVGLHTGQPFAQNVEWLAHELDRCANESHDAHRLASLFDQMLQHEIAFHDAAYQGA